jgi:hypothetical protein
VAGNYQRSQQEKHQKKLDDIRDQVATGKLVIRQMTAAERKRYPPVDDAKARQRDKRRW